MEEKSDMMIDDGQREREDCLGLGSFIGDGDVGVVGSRCGNNNDNGGRCGNGYGKGGKCSRRGNVSRGGCNVLLFW